MSKRKAPTGAAKNAAAPGNSNALADPSRYVIKRATRWAWWSGRMWRGFPECAQIFKTRNAALEAIARKKLDLAEVVQVKDVLE